MKVCMITTSFPRFSGDYSGIFIHRLCKALCSPEVHISIVTPSHGKALSLERVTGCDVHRFQYFFPKSFQRFAYGPGGIPANLKRHPWLIGVAPFFIFMFILKALQVSKKADLIHAQWLYSGMIASLIKVIRGTPFIVTLRGSDVCYAQKGNLYGLISRWVIRQADFVTTVSDELSKWAVRQGLPDHAVVVIRNGVDIGCATDRKPPSSTCDFIFVGNLVQGKGVHYLIQALSLVHRLEKDISLTVVGEGDAHDQLQCLVNEKGLRDIVRFTGRRSSEEVFLFMRQSACLVLPSLSEGMPNVVLEAMACGIPVVASDLPGIREVVQDEETGFLVAPRDVEDLAQKLLILVQNPERRQKMGDRAYHSFSEMSLSWPKAAKQYLEVYRKVCAASRASST